MSLEEVHARHQCEWQLYLWFRRSTFPVHQERLATYRHSPSILLPAKSRHLHNSLMSPFANSAECFVKRKLPGSGSRYQLREMTVERITNLDWPEYMLSLVH